ncbi:MAG: TrkA family potassium uptake protein [Planctomycetaceae bacterium]
MRRIASIIGLLTGLISVGAIGFRMASGGAWIDCFYMAVITITTVGFNEAVPLGPWGRLFVMVYLFCGLGVFTYMLAQIGEWVMSARVQTMLELRRMQKRIDQFNNHYIICGAGRMGRTIAQFLRERDKPFVLIDSDEEVLTAVCDRGNFASVLGDATQDETLQQAGIDRATSLAIVLSTDADNLFVTLSARLLRPDLQIVARAQEDETTQKLERAGANRVISPTSTGATKMARLMLAPSMEDFFTLANDAGESLELADFSINDGSPLVGKRLSETSLRGQGVMIVGIRRATGERLIPPDGATQLHAGDCLFVFGDVSAVESVLAANEGKSSVE